MTKHALGFPADHTYKARIENVIDNQLRRSYQSKRYGKIKYAYRFISCHALFQHQLYRGEAPWCGRVEDMTMTDAHFKNAEFEEAYWKRLNELGEEKCGALWRWRPVNRMNIQQVCKAFATFWMEHERVTKEEFKADCCRYLREKLGTELKQWEEECPTTTD